MRNRSFLTQRTSEHPSVAVMIFNGRLCPRNTGSMSCARCCCREAQIANFTSIFRIGSLLRLLTSQEIPEIFIARVRHPIYLETSCGNGLGGLMRKSFIYFALGIALAVSALPEKALALPIDSSVARASGDFTDLIESIQYRSGRFIDERARQRYINRRWSNRTVTVEPDGTVLLPGIETDRFGRTIMRGPPRSRYGTPARIGVWQGGTGGRLTGNVPQVNKRKH
jgi:hypothetical protein